eukprot:CAMPEP_0202961982 /NCGR_PEP_ID=MMETSP1396-20130829/6082_1 /ASSEMBLY_ACC=CAM_ASM_000872 /TAXON_ID= /ORGANISM="Pseudokeronopsis sp., Strain Brazil" /LENGTH=74 /DNA_ID=CAMNT_0049682239 /DNA_START=803 /DNA_END=1027 /DNA_ORIENTATION=-
MVCAVDADTALGKKFALLAGLDEDLPQIRILDPNPGKHFAIKYKFPFAAPISKDSIVEFVNEFLGGRLRPYQMV